MTHQPNYMRAFREARKAMGFTHTSAYIPHNRLAEFSLYVERLKAERMIEICDLLPTSGERIALASRNTTDVPTPEAVQAFAARYPNQKAIAKQAAQCVQELITANSAMNTSKLEQATEEEAVKWMSLAVAHNNMANVLWREMVQMASQIEGKN